MSHFQIGWAEYSLTPDKKVSLVGQFAERISEYVEKPLCVTAMAVSTDSDQAVFCSCDLVGVSWSLRDAVREKLAGNTVGLDPMKVIISAIHTHTGPGYTGRGNSSGRFSRDRAGRRASGVPLRPDRQSRARSVGKARPRRLLERVRPRCRRHVPPRVL